jgi:hypothetical protein
MSRLTGVTWLVALIGCVSGVPAAFASDDGLLPSRAQVPGFHAAGHGASVARTAVGGRPLAALRHAPAQGAAFRSGSQELTFGVFTFAGNASARHALGHLRAGRRHVDVGVAGWELSRSAKRRADVAIAFRVGTALGTVRFRAHGPRKAVAAVALANARSLVARLRRVLALSAWQRTLDGIHADGSITPQLALQAFSRAYGPLPGVHTPPRPGGSAPEATLAMQLVARVWDRLTAAQQAAIDRDLGAPHDASSPGVAQSAVQTLTPNPQLQAVVDRYNALYRGKLPGAPPVTIKVFSASEKIPYPKPGYDTLADALPLNAGGQWGVGAPAYCRVRVPPAGRALNPRVLDVVLAHEAFHCYEFVLMANWRERSAWIIEGMADWAALNVDPLPSSVSAANYREYLSTPETPLFSRSYDAVGFWGHADEVAGPGSLWAKIPAVLGAPDDPASFAAAGATGSPFVETWASAFWRFPDAGDAWQQTDPLPISGIDFPGFDYHIVNDSSSLFSAPHAVSEFYLTADPEQPLVEVVTSEGKLRVGLRKKDFGVGDTQWFCDTKCECPSGESSTIPPHERFGQSLALALTGGAFPGHGRVNYHSLDDYCKPQPAKGLQILGKGHDVHATFTTGTCSVRKGQFHAFAKDGAWSIDVRIPHFGSYKDVYDLAVGSNAGFVVKGPGGPYSNANPAPNHGPSFGQIRFYPNGTKMSLGFEYAWNASATNGVLPLGVMACTKPKR